MLTIVTDTSWPGMRVVQAWDRNADRLLWCLAWPTALAPNFAPLSVIHIDTVWAD